MAEILWKSAFWTFELERGARAVRTTSVSLGRKHRTSRRIGSCWPGVFTPWLQDLAMHSGSAGMKPSELVKSVANNPIGSGLITSLILFVLGLGTELLDKHLQKQYQYMTGEYYGYYFLRDNATLVTMQVTVSSAYF